MVVVYLNDKFNLKIPYDHTDNIIKILVILIILVILYYFIYIKKYINSIVILQELRSFFFLYNFYFYRSYITRLDYIK